MNTENIKTTENAVRELIRETAKSKEGLKKLFSILKECGEHACLCGCPDKDTGAKNIQRSYASPCPAARGRSIHRGCAPNIRRNWF